MDCCARLRRAFPSPLDCELSAKPLHLLPRGVTLRLEDFAALALDFVAPARALALDHQPALGPTEELHGVELELGLLSLEFVRFRFHPDAARRRPVEGIRALRQQSREPFVAHEPPIADSGVERGVVPQQLGVELLHTALLELLPQAPEASPVRESTFEDRDLGTALELCGGPHREVEDAQRPAGRPNEPGLVRGRRGVAPLGVANGAVNGAARGAKRLRHVPARPGQGYVVPTSVEHDDIRLRPVGDLGLQARARLAHGKAGRERTRAVGSSHELRARGDHHAIPLRNRGKRLRERAAQRPPELVGVRVDHPVGPELRGGQPGHVRQPARAALPEVGRRLVDHVGEPRVRVALKDLGGFVRGSVVGDHEAVHSERMVEAEVGLEDVAFISDL